MSVNVVLIQKSGPNATNHDSISDYIRSCLGTSPQKHWFVYPTPDRLKHHVTPCQQPCIEEELFDVVKTDRQTLRRNHEKAVASSSFLQPRPKFVVAAPTASRSTTSWWTTSVCRRVEAGARCASARRTSATQPPLPAPSTTFSLPLPSSSSSSSVTSGTRPPPRWLNLRCSSYLSRFLFIFVFLRGNLSSLQLTQSSVRAQSVVLFSMYGGFSFLPSFTFFFSFASICNCYCTTAAATAAATACTFALRLEIIFIAYTLHLLA